MAIITGPTESIRPRRGWCGSYSRAAAGGVGNAFSIAIAPDGAVIQNAVLEGAIPERYALGELRAALETWIAAIERARRNPE